MHNNRRICIVMASFPHRHELMISAVNQLISQCDDFYLWLNQYDKVPDELLKFKGKLHVKVNVPDLKDNGRYTFLNDCKDDYCFICDDDISWPSNYVSNTLQCFDRNGDDIITAYFINGRQDFIDEYQHDIVVGNSARSFGSGTCAFIPSKLQCNITQKELDEGYDCEIFLANACAKSKMSLVSPKRPANFLSWCKIGNAHSNDSFALHLNGCNDRRAKTFDYIMKTRLHLPFHKASYNELVNMSFMIDTGQLEYTEKVFKYHRLHMPSNVIDAKHSNVVKCHYDAVRFAQKHNWPFVLVFEDTAYPIENARQELEACLQSLDHQCNALMLGNIEFESSGKRIGKFINFIKNHGSHSYILFEQCYDYVLSHENECLKIDDVIQRMNDRFAYEKCLFIQMHVKEDSIECICKNKDVVAQCPAFDEILSWNAFLSQSIKIANVTNLSDWNNYGQRLQTYALQQFIKKSFNIDMYTLDTRSFYTTFGKSKCFHAFEQNCMNFIKIRSFTDSRLKRVDMILVGGDQNWNSYNEHYNGKHYEDFAKLVSYSSSAASGKLDKIDSSSEQQVRQLSKFSMLSFREMSTSMSMSAELRRRGCKTNVSYSIDPIFLLSEDEWMQIAQKPDFIKDNATFDFQYSIGNKKPTIVEQQDARRYICYGNNNEDTMSLQNFIWMMKHCRKLYTSSFHGTAFGVLFNKLIVIDASKANDMRVKNLVNMFKLKIQDRCIDARCKTSIQSIISIERQRSFDWLKKSISVNDICYACYAKDKSTRDKSASGGVSAKLAYNAISQNGVVYGAAYSNDFRSVECVAVDSMNDYFNRISGSKYSLCKMPSINEVKDCLESGRLVLFTGCPCQIIKLKQSLQREYSNLITVDLLCNGCSRPDVLHQFVDQQERQHNSKVISIDMRHNHSSNLKISFSNGTSKVIENGSRKMFVCCPSNYIAECKSCSMHMHGHGNADITIGDFWEYNKHRDIFTQDFSPANGTSIVHINTIAGMKFFNDIKNELAFKYVR